MSYSTFALADSAIIIVGVAILIFGAYRAFASRKVLADPSYRNLAVWTGALLLLAIPYELNLVRQELGLGYAGPVNAAYDAVVALAGGVVGFALLDRAVHLGLGLDFFHRDILSWEKRGRYVVWPVATVSLASYWVLNFSYGAFITFLVLVYPLVVLAISTSRAHESAILDYIKWWGVTLIGAVGATAVGVFTGFNFLQILVAYFFYRTAGSLSGSTYHADLSFFFAAPRDYVYSVYTDPNLLTKITTVYTSAKLEEKLPDGTDVVDVAIRVFGMNISGKLIRGYFPPMGMDEELRTASGDGTTRFKFLEEDRGTKITVSIDFEPRGALTKFFGGLGARQARNQFKRDFATGKAYCEANKPKSVKE